VYEIWTEPVVWPDAGFMEKRINEKIATHKSFMPQVMKN
jgi:hypothetical protein